jgi:hypothetical protein
MGSLGLPIRLDILRRHRRPLDAAARAYIPWRAIESSCMNAWESAAEGR